MQLQPREHLLNDPPKKDGRYLVKFYTKYRPDYDNTELVWRGYYNGEWDNPIYGYRGDGYEMISWIDHKETE